MTAREAYENNALKCHILLKKIEAGLEPVPPAGVHWGHVGDLAHLAEQLQEIHDSLYGEGEYAEVA